MKDFNRNICTARQGEVYFMRVDKLPDGLKPVQPENGRYILAHSETGHHHVMKARENIRFFESGDPLVSYLEVIEATDESEALLEHLRSFDTHETIRFSEGIYAAITARESTPEGWRKAQD